MVTTSSAQRRSDQFLKKEDGERMNWLCVPRGSSALLSQLFSACTAVGDVAWGQLWVLWVKAANSCQERSTE